MPYIPQERRNDQPAETAGDLHHDIAKLIDTYLFSGGVTEEPPHYQDFNDVMGVLACAQAEVYRRLIAPYEDQARQRNGDVFSGTDNNDRDQSFQCSTDGQECSSPYCTCQE